MPGWVLHLWNEWSIQILILLSFTLQVFILVFAGMRRRNSLAWRLLLWLAYLLAESTALYTLGHISNSKLPELGPAAFWAQFLLLHLGGQDTMTAYALEDNQLWLRHLLTLVLQSLGAAYLFYRHIADGGTLLVMAAVLIYLVGFMKYGERVWTLKSSSRDGITNFLDNLKLDQSPEGPFHNDGAYDAEDVLRDAHNLLYICMGQFVDYKVWPSLYQSGVIIKYCTGDGGEMFQSHYQTKLFELTGMQLSLMHDIFYTKAVVIHTWYGCCTRALSLVATVTALLLFKLKTGKDGYTRADVAFTYTLLVGAIVLEMASILRAMGSSWTCAICIDKIKNPALSSTWEFARRNGILDGFHSALKFLRRMIKSAEHGRKWPGSIGQHDLLGLFTMKLNLSSMIATIAGLDRWLNKRRITLTVDIYDLPEKVPKETLKEIERMVKACRGNEDMLRSYRGQCALRGWEGYSADLTGWCIDIDFDESILAWHLATNFFLFARVWDNSTTENLRLMYAIRVLSNYMMFLLVEHPYMLPSPVRARQYDLAYSWLLTVARTDGPFVTSSRRIDHDKMKLVLERVQQGQSGSPAVLVRGAALATTLLDLSNDGPEEHLLRVILGVWVEMLCYAASHCSRDSHARQLNSGPEFITVVWILQATMFNYINGDTAWVRRATDDFFQSRNQPAQQ